MFQVREEAMCSPSGAGAEAAGVGVFGERLDAAGRLGSASPRWVWRARRKVIGGNAVRIGDRLFRVTDRGGNCPRDSCMDGAFVRESRSLPP